jgi:parvulin-like peptidyl-prolyl isomerase
MDRQPVVKPILQRSFAVLRQHRTVTITLLAVLSILLPACNTTESEDLVAKVGTRNITMKQVDSVIKQQLDASAGQVAPLTAAELVAARLNVIDRLIQDEALFIKAEKENLVPDDNKVSQEIQKRKQQASLTEEQYQNQIKQAGLSEDEVRENVRKELAIGALNERERARVKAPSEDEIRKYYEDHKAEYVADRGVDISIIVTDPNNNGARDDAIGDVASEQKIKAIYEELRAGSRDFATIAQQRSEDASSIRGGSLGFGTEAALKQMFPTRPEIPQRLMSMSAGQYTEPIKDNLSGRWVIFKVNGKREQAQKLTLEDESVRRNIVDTLTQQRQQLLLNALLMVAMTETAIKNHFAQRIVEKPDTVTTMRPSALLEQTGGGQQPPPPQPQPRIENENSNRSTTGNSNAPARGNGNNSNSPK